MPKKLPNPPYKIEDHGYITPCWIWLGTKRKGYGMIHNTEYKNTGVLKMKQAHVHFYELAKGKIPFGLLPDHLCRIRSCINPEHIELVSNKENIRRGKVAIINLEIANKIREDYATGNFKYEHLATIYNISISTISQIITYKTWIS